MADQQQLIQIQVHGDQHLVFDVKDVQRLRDEHGLIGSLLGTLPRYPQQNGFFGLPMLLFPEVAALAVREGFATLTKAQGTPEPVIDETKYLVYRYLWRQGLYMTHGMKFGGDYLAYPGDPMRYHSHYVVRAQDRKETWTMTDLVAMGRLAVTTKKTFVLASPMDNDSDHVQCVTIAWAGF
ncbi:tRNA intron endonuclease [Gongronella butleri]|nr:tRNA intron endonuclease [Gongronella butleri]